MVSVSVVAVLIVTLLVRVCPTAAVRGRTRIVTLRCVPGGMVPKVQVKLNWAPGRDNAFAAIGEQLVVPFAGVAEINLTFGGNKSTTCTFAALLKPTSAAGPGSLMPFLAETM